MYWPEAAKELVPHPLHLHLHVVSYDDQHALLTLLTFTNILLIMNTGAGEGFDECLDRISSNTLFTESLKDIQQEF